MIQLIQLKLYEKYKRWFNKKILRYMSKCRLNYKKINTILKVTLRERIAQTGYRKIKLSQDEVTKHIRVFFVTLGEDGTLTIKTPAKKGRAIVEVDTDGSYVMSETEVEESNKVKMFDKFIDDIKRLLI
jgi:hypothetical protein